ncbi:MAG: putative oxidoreductase [Phycisphaerales bacterium]|nr:putative oxidoreductase [Phycisphaerales bacterium]
MTKISFVGVAHIHVPGFVNMLKKHTDVQVASVWDADPARRSHWAKATGAREAASPDEAIAAADAVVITSQTDGHAPLVASVAKSRKHVFVEKPLGMAHADAAEMAAAIEATGVIFQTGYFMRSEAPVQAIKKLIDSGALGQITKATASNAHSGAIGDWFKKKPDAPAEDWNWMTDVKQSGVGAFGDLGTHVLDILISWFGDVARVTAQIDNVTNTYGCDESGQGLIRFKSGVTATLTAGWVDVADPVRFLVSGTKGLAMVSNGKLYVTKDGKFDLSTPHTDLPPAAPHAFELFLEAITDKTPAVPLVTVREAAYRSTVMAAMYEGAKNAKWVTPA